MKLTDICGNDHAKRALEVAAAGSHSIQFIGAFESQASDLPLAVCKDRVRSRADLA